MASIILESTKKMSMSKPWSGYSTCWLQYGAGMTWILGRGGCSGWGVQWIAGTGGATSRTLTETFETQSVSQIQVKIASDYTWFPLHPPLRYVDDPAVARPGVGDLLVPAVVEDAAAPVVVPERRGGYC